MLTPKNSKTGNHKSSFYAHLFFPGRGSSGKLFSNPVSLFAGLK